MLSHNVLHILIVTLTNNVSKALVDMHVAQLHVVSTLHVFPNFTMVFANVLEDLVEIQILHVQRVNIKRAFYICNLLKYFLIPSLGEIALPPVEFGCTSDNDCPDYTACQNRKCINPCAERRVCAPNAICTVTRHKAVCACPDGYIGTPEVTCERRK